MKQLSELKVAIVHDWLVGGGAELVVLELHKLFPNAPIYTSYCTDEWRQKLDGKVKTGYLQYWPFSRLRKYLPLLRYWWFSRLNLSGYDLVISSAGNGEAKAVKVPKPAVHICYCHSPTHFYWRHYQQYVKRPGFGILTGQALKLLSGPLRRLDYKSAQNPDYYIANSVHIKNDIKQFYGRDAEVIYPPVNTSRFANLTNQKRQGFVTVGRQVPYKNVSIIVEACSKLNLPLSVIGKGPEYKHLVQIAGPSISFLENATDQDVNNYLGKSEAFILAAFEDFGITPVEAIAAGTPVIAYKAGGAIDYVIPGKTGEFFEDQTADSLASVLKSFDASKYNQTEIQNSAQKFSIASFHENMEKYINKVMNNEPKEPNQ